MNTHRVKIWDLPVEDDSPAARFCERTEDLVSTTLTYIGSFRIVRTRHFINRHGWIFLAIATAMLALTTI